MRKKIFILLIVLLTAKFLYADDVKFIASLQKNPVIQGERFRITFTLHNAQGNRFTPPSFRSFNTLMGPSTQQSTQIINGKVSQQVSYTYVLQAKKKGSFTIGPATITVNGNPIKSNSLTVEIVEPSEAEKRRRAQAKQEEQNLSQQAEEIINKNLFVTLSVNKRNVYLSEPLTATYKLYVHPELNLTSLSPKNPPSFNGFWTQEFDLRKVNWQNEVVNGVLFRSAIVKKVLLLPQQTGKLTLEPFKFDCSARFRVQSRQSRRRSMWDDFFDDPFFGGGGNYKTFSHIVSSKTIRINVKPLPEPQPDNFIGLVGNFKFEAWIDKSKTKVGEPISLKLKFTGGGNLKLLEPLDLKFPPDFDIYDPKTADNTNLTGSGISGSKIFEYLIIPKNEGKYKIPPVDISYFDLSSNDYKNLKSEEFNITVGKGDGSTGGAVSGIQKEDIKFLGKDIRYIKYDVVLSKDNKRFLSSLYFYILSFLPLFLFLFIIIYKKRRDELVNNQSLWKSKQATKIARKRLSAAKKLMESKQEEKFYEEISRALWGYISDKLSIPVSELSKESSERNLLQNNIDKSLIEQYLELIDKSEFARFTPNAKSIQMDDIYNRAVGVISDMEGQLK